MASQSLTAISSPIRARSARTSLMSIMCVGRAASRLLDRRLRVEPAPFGHQSLQQRRRLPVIAEARTIFIDAREHDVQADRVGVKHRAAAMTREPEAVDINDIDVAGARGKSFFEHACAL